MLNGMTDGHHRARIHCRYRILEQKLCKGGEWARNKSGMLLLLKGQENLQKIDVDTILTEANLTKNGERRLTKEVYDDFHGNRSL